MISAETIDELQNEEQYLKIQYASRLYYNRAEIINYLSWTLCLMSSLMVFLPDNTVKIITICSPLVLDGAALIAIWVFNKMLKNAADLRAFFDAQVLMINAETYSEIDKRRLLELSEYIFEKKRAEAEESFRNTGEKIPPGVRNWYVFKNPVDGLEAQFECQRQNIWWNKKMVRKRQAVLFVVSLLMIALFIISLINFSSSRLSIISCYAGIALKLIERGIEHKNYYDASLKIEAIQEHIESHLTMDGIQKLQNLINERRRIPVLEINLMHKKNAKKLSSTYRSIS